MRLSPARERWPLLFGLDLLHRGKVRDTYRLDDEHLLIVTTDAVSIFDFVLNAIVPWKGTVLNCLTHWWLQQLPALNVATHFVATGASIDQFLPQPLRGNPELRARAMVVKRMKVHPVEFVIRGHLTGSVLSGYQRDGVVFGRRLPPGLQDGDQLPCLMDTPTTKSDEGHDEPMSADDIRMRYGKETIHAREIFEYAAWVARSRGIVLVDTKFEFGNHMGVVHLVDEVLTPDSSRYWDLRDWETMQRQSERHAPTPLDKQLVRAWGKGHNLHTLDPSNPDHVAFVHGLVVADDVLTNATATYRYLFWRLTGMTIEAYLEAYLSDALGVRATLTPRRLAVVMGSESDFQTVKDAFDVTGRRRQPYSFAKVDCHVISCHRNPGPLRDFVVGRARGYDAIIACGSKALALPGVLDALLAEAGVTVPVIGVALGETGSRSLLAAQLSISELPGAHVVMNEMMGEPYTGIEGLADAILRVALGELPPPRPRTAKPARFFIS